MFKKFINYIKSFIKKDCVCAPGCCEVKAPTKKKKAKNKK